MSSLLHLLKSFCANTIIVFSSTKTFDIIQYNNKISLLCSSYQAPARIRSFSSLPTLKNGLFLGATITSMPVFGFLPE